jgi:hypothetical protein
MALEFDAQAIALAAETLTEALVAHGDDVGAAPHTNGVQT